MDMNLDDVAATRGDLKDAMRELRGELKASHRGLALEIVKTNARIDKLGEDLRGEMRSLHSDLVRKIDGFMSHVGKIDRAQVIADWRVTQLEKRVDDIKPQTS